MAGFGLPILFVTDLLCVIHGYTDQLAAFCSMVLKPYSPNLSVFIGGEIVDSFSGVATAAVAGKLIFFSFDLRDSPQLRNGIQNVEELINRALFIIGREAVVFTEGGSDKTRAG